MNKLDTEKKCIETTVKSTGPIRILKSDNDIKLFPLISEVGGHHSIADYCIFTNFGIFICDLKSGKGDKAKNQILNTRLLIDYLISFMKQHYKMEAKFIPEIEYLVFSGIVSKGIAKPKKPTKSSYRGFEYFELGCGGTYQLDDFIK